MKAQSGTAVCEWTGTEWKIVFIGKGAVREFKRIMRTILGSKIRFVHVLNKRVGDTLK